MDEAVAERTLRATVMPSPFDGLAEAEVGVTVNGGLVSLAGGGRRASFRPVRAVLGHGTLWLDTETAGRLRLTFAGYDLPAYARQHTAHLTALYQELAAAGLRDFLVDLRAAGVPLRTAPRVRGGAGIHRTAAWVAAAALLFVELGLFGLPSITAGAVIGGVLTTSTWWGDAAVATGLIAFGLLAIVSSPVPVLVRRAFAQGSTRDPIRYLDTWAGRPPEEDQLRPGERLAFVPGVPRLPAAFLLVGCAVAAAGGRLAATAEPTSAPRTGQLAVPEPAWLDGDAIAVFGYAGALLLLAVFGASLVRWRQAPEWYPIRWAPLVGAVLCFGFGQAGTGMPLNPAEQWLYLVLVGVVVAFTCGRIAVGFGLLAAMTGLLLLAAFGFFESAAAALPLLPVLVLLTAIAVRYLPGGSRLVSVSTDRVDRLRRLVWTLWSVTIVLGVGLTVVAGAFLQPG